MEKVVRKETDREWREWSERRLAENGESRQKGDWQRMERVVRKETGREWRESSERRLAENGESRQKGDWQRMERVVRKQGTDVETHI